jgi:iron complex outermembrane receptor protein
LFLLIFAAVNAQNIIKGTITDEYTNEPLPFATVYIACDDNGILADANGKFSVAVSKDTCEVVFTQTFYNTIKRQVTFSPGQRELMVNMKLGKLAEMLQQVTVTASKYETDPAKSTNTILVLSPKIAEDRNFTTVDALLNTAAGVAVVDNEPQIRGGSGFSSGMGSRVMILLDNMPLLRPDAGRPMWTFIPMEDVEQVEVLKGAASVVFGSSALTGAINVHTAYPRMKPKTKISTFAGIYSDPNPSGKEVYQASWNHSNPVKYGVSFLHSRIIKNNFDFVIGGEFFNDQGYIGPEERLSVTRDTNGSTTGKYEIRSRLNFATRYRFQKVKGLAVSLNGNIMYSDNAQSFFWYDANENRYRTYKGSLSKFKDFTFYVDPTVTYVRDNGEMHTLRNRIMRSNNNESTGAQTAQSFSSFNEYQYNRNIQRYALKIVAGAMNNYVISSGRVFSGDIYSDDTTRMTANNFALYVQLEKSFLKKKQLTFLIGGRWEFYSMEGVSENKPIFRTGLNYQLKKSKTAFRASFGQGYRFPTLGEKFIAISIGRYGFYPNPNLVSEKSWNLEAGVMQPFRLSEFQGVFDLAVFTQHYDNYIEFAMGVWGTKGSLMDRIGFKYLNIGPARINGVDFSVMGEGKISRNVTYMLNFSYTFSSPISLDPDYVYYKDSATKREYSFNNSSLDTGRLVLKYRIEHMAKFDLAFTFAKKFTIGLSANYFSAMKNIDKFFFEYDIENPTHSNTYKEYVLTPLGDLPFSGYYNYFYANQKGSIIFDARVSCMIKNVTLSFIVKNLMNKSYTLRPMYVEPPRTFNLQVVYNLN